MAKMTDEERFWLEQWANGRPPPDNIPAYGIKIDISSSKAVEAFRRWCASKLAGDKAAPRNFV